MELTTQKSIKEGNETHSLQSKQSPAKQDASTNSAVRADAFASQSSYDVPLGCAEHKLRLRSAAQGNAHQEGDRAWAYLQLMRPANIITAWADILAGFAVLGIAIANPDIAWLLLATTGLYGGGVVLNDVFDAELDELERPERPIPSGRVSRQKAAWLGSMLLIVGILAAARVSLLSMAIAICVASAAILYNAVSKHHVIFGPLNMGCCRGGNLLLGMSVVPNVLVERWWLALLPIVYIAAITAISQGEVRGGKRKTGIFALFCLVIVFGSILTLGLLTNYLILTALPFLILLAIRVVPPFIAAARNPLPDIIQLAVKAGVLSLIILDATIAAGFVSWYGLLVLSLLPISLWVAKKLAVT